VENNVLHILRRVTVVTQNIGFSEKEIQHKYNAVNCFFFFKIEMDDLENYVITNLYCIGCSFKFIRKVGIEESIVNAPRITSHGSAA
jgi:hypothetical protein